MKKKNRTKTPTSTALENVKGGFLVIEDDVILRDPGDTDEDGIVIEDHIIFRDAP